MHAAAGVSGEPGEPPYEISPPPPADATGCGLTAPIHTSLRTLPRPTACWAPTSLLGAFSCVLPLSDDQARIGRVSQEQEQREGVDQFERWAGSRVSGRVSDSGDAQVTWEARDGGFLVTSVWWRYAHIVLIACY